MWSSKHHNTTSRSNVEAEYRGVANVVAETCCIHNLFLKLHYKPAKATIVYCDNVSAFYMSYNLVHHQCTKNIEIDLHFARVKLATGHVRVFHVPSSLQYAYIYTKSLLLPLFLDFHSSLNVRDSHPVQNVGAVSVILLCICIISI